MRVVVYKDKRITQKVYDKLIADYSSFIVKHTNITPIFWTEEYDYSDYPTYLDTDGDDVMRPSFIEDFVKKTTSKYSNYGADHIVTLIHQDNWKSGKTATRKGIWGTNYSYRYGNYQVHYCRFDNTNLANSFGTLYHEMFHSFDALIQVETGVDIQPILQVKAFDAEIVHGASPDYKYIRYQENTDALAKLAPYLKSAYLARQNKHTEAIKGMQLTIISLLEKLVEIYRQRLYKK